MSTLTINGREAPAKAHFDVLNPSTGEVYDRAPDATREQLDEAMESASDALEEWQKSEDFRKAKMLELSEAMMSAVPEFAELLAYENGKTFDIGGMEGMVAATWLDYYANLEIPREIIRDDDGARVEILRKPLGVVGAIAPWNMPVGLAFFKIAPALRAGNTVVLKPSPFTPFSTLRVGEIAREILPPGVLNVVSGGDELGGWITEHPVPRKISFTGSVDTGRKVNIAAAKDFKRVTLELGGNDPAILLDDVDVDAIAEGLFWTGFFNNGQACALVKRVYAPEKIYDDVVEALAAVARKVVVGDPNQIEEAQLGPLSTRPQFERVSGLVADAVSRGARCAAGGSAIEGKGLFFEPTILSNVSDGVAIVDEEQFGPALPIIKYTDVDDAVARANKSTFGLGASVWSADIERGSAIARRLDAGSTWVNTHAALAPSSPFGGHGWSGIGVENGPWGLYGFTEIQVLHENRGIPGPGAL
ncbi:aldehyde dehydrogenase [Rhodococcus sp. SC4]|nr:aldehyde dehydrogenase [Rhodococcus sp. SC4]